MAARYGKSVTLPCLLVTASLIVLISGCVVKETGGNFARTVSGDYFLSLDDPKAGEEYFYRQVTAQPHNSIANYYYGRILLRSAKASAALPYLQEAARLDPQNADYQFWVGVAHGGLRQESQERAGYERALQLNPEHQQALTALGHNYLRSAQYKRALQAYDKALGLKPDNPAALYSRALTLSRLGRTEEEKRAWHRYLAVNTSGGLASKAVEHLNRRGDFSYRNYRLGPRTITVARIEFLAAGSEVAKESRPGLEVIGEAVSGMRPDVVLQVVVYQQGDAQLAKARALAVRRQLQRSFPRLGTERIGVSWFGEAQRDTKKKWLIEESVDFFVTTK